MLPPNDLLFGTAAVAVLQRAFGGAAPWIGRALSLFGGVEGIVIVAVLARALRGRRAAEETIAALALALPVTHALTRVLGVARPEGAGIIAYEQIPTASFPSGHVVVAVVGWGWLAQRHGAHPAIVAALTVAVAAGRLLLGMHSLADVLAGALFGALLVAALSRGLDPLLALIRRTLGKSSPAVQATFAAINVAVATVIVLALGASATAIRAVGLIAGCAVGLVRRDRGPLRPATAALVVLPILATATLGDALVPPAVSACVIAAVAACGLSIAPRRSDA